MQTVFWLIIACLAAGLGSALAWIIRGKASESRSEGLQQLVQEERRRSAQATADAARVPDLLARCAKAEQAASDAAASLQRLAASESGLTARLDEAQQELERTRQGHSEVLKDLADKTEALIQAQRTAAQFESSTRSKAEEAQRLASDLASTRTSLSEIATELAEAYSSLATANAQRDAAIEAHLQSKAFLSDAQEKLRAAFTDAASRVFDEKARALQDHIKESSIESKRGLAETLQPFATRIEGLQTKIEALASEEAKERATLVGALGELKTLNQDMADATNSLTRALRSNSKVRGQWGELILETVLKASGLVEGANFQKQAKSNDEESGQRRFADIVVTLPDGRSVVVDSKVNLVAWAEAADAETPEATRSALERHAAALRLHMRDLADKNYPKTIGPDCLEMTVLFVPIEGALSDALSINPDLQMEAFERRVVFASPNTLMAMLQVVSRLWTRDKLQRQVEVIGTEAGKLIDSVIGLLEDFEDLGRQIGKSEAAFRQAKGRLTDSSHSVMARARRLVEAGAKGKKQIPEELASLAEPQLLQLGPVSGAAEPEVG